MHLISKMPVSVRLRRRNRRFTRSLASRLLRHIAEATAFVFLLVSATSAQITEADRDFAVASQQEHDEQSHGRDGKHMDHAQGQMSMEASTEEGIALPSAHASSGTGWQPASVPSHLWMTSRGGWELMLHGNVFVRYNQQGGPRGAGKAESANYVMLMEQHRIGQGVLLLREMFSAESLTSPHPGFPQLFQTGETYHGQPLVDHQHPHNVFAELAAYYTLPIREKVTWLLYGGPSAEPALGPVTYMHRASAAENPSAPLGHHLQDSTHTSFGVVTTGFIIDRFKVEASAFNGREPNEERWSIQAGALDSWSLRAAPQFSLGAFRRSARHSAQRPCADCR